MNRPAPLRLAVTLGDPRGIGPEVMTRAARQFVEENPDIGMVLLGAREDLARAGEGFATEPTGAFDGSAASAGSVALHAIERGVALAMAGEVSALVTGPVHKPALHAAGTPVPGQTELLQALTGAPAVGMLMNAESTRLGVPLRVLLATTHLPLREVPGRVTRALVFEQARLLNEALQERWGIASPRIALCALNPHASDGGLFGNEEAEVLQPAVRELQEEGMGITGPFPADTVFLRMVDRGADAVVVPYHDVGMAVFKTLSFGRGVNVTLGLPFVRTSPDHGTAFGLVGTGRADPASALEAMRLAVRLAAPRGPSIL